MTASRLSTFSHAGLTFDVIDEGPIDGPVAVLLHGFPQRASSWNGVAGLLHGQGIRTVAPDQRGYSPRARPRGRSAYRLGHLAADVNQLIDTLDAGPVHLVGHDWGAVVAWAVATDPARVRSLTAVSVAHPTAFLRSMLGAQAAKSWYIGAFQLPRLPEKLLSDPRRAGRFLGGSGMTRGMTETYQRDIVDHGALPGALNWYRALPLTDPRAATGRISVPTTMVWSDRDVALGRRGIDLTEEYVDAPYSLHVLGGVSHWIPDEAPDVLAEIVCERIDSVENGGS
ncbi:alpha/beta fold hydrolase [Nocardioides sp. JQ2195]|uniref:alpha/beta fold hydrolase n=1 Tax=Nocardioides sp. JQ2195 TaxID=2592334 RepID=UPI00143E6607|nr:alpha/beta fold hydrolase [Nocardioides sp. JQ2195]QIX28372.1 alpha/beta fold hydrolase [Nocardioides sp. JQ2195]